MNKAVLKTPGIYYFDGMTVKKLRKLKHIDIFGEESRSIEFEYPIKSVYFTKKAKERLMREIRYAMIKSRNIGIQAGYNYAVEDQFLNEDETAIFD